jgi:hypothetical protein
MYIILLQQILFGFWLVSGSLLGFEVNNTGFDLLKSIEKLAFSGADVDMGLDVGAFVFICS